MTGYINQVLDMHIFQLLIGVSMLLFGRRLFWLFVGVAGFILGIHVAARFFHGQPELNILLIALAAGLLGALFAVLLQKAAIGFAGFILGGYVLTGMLAELGWRTGHYHWIIYLIGGIIGLFLVSSLFGWALIILSSVSGALLVLQPFHPAMAARRLIFFMLVVCGISVQAGLLRKTQRRPPR